MLKWFFPHEVQFFDYFDKHAHILIRASETLKQLTSANSDIPKITREIKDLEHQADQITHICVEELHKTFITPIQREDILSLISRMDDVIDLMDEVSERISIYKITTMKPDANKLIEVLSRATHEVNEILKNLRELKYNDETKAILVRINELENLGDKIHLQAISSLFSDVKDPIEILKWKEIYDRLEDAIDSCEDIAQIVEGIILESS